MIRGKYKDITNSTLSKQYGRIYNIRMCMKRRCKYNYLYKDIKIEWNSFYEFYEDMNESYLEHQNQYGERQTTIDRIDGSLNYSKGNCRWATYKIQNEPHRKRQH